jgi:hypothetical protein
MSDYVVNSVIDQLLRQQAAIAPTSVYVALIIAENGIHATSTTYGAGATVTVSAEDGEYHLYTTSAGGESAASAPAFPGMANETVVDGSVIWVEQDANLKSGAAIVEPTIGVGGYARQQIVSSLANWAGTQGAGSTTASSGTSGTTSNNNTVTFPSPTSNWAASPSVAWGIALYDAATGGNLLFWGPLAPPATIPNGSPPPYIPTSTLLFFLT